jgi:hypothetical protein
LFSWTKADVFVVTDDRSTADRGVLRFFDCSRVQLFVRVFKSSIIRLFERLFDYFSLQVFECSSVQVLDCLLPTEKATEWSWAVVRTVARFHHAPGFLTTEISRMPKSFEYARRPLLHVQMCCCGCIVFRYAHTFVVIVVHCDFSKGRRELASLSLCHRASRSPVCAIRKGENDQLMLFQINAHLSVLQQGFAVSHGFYCRRYCVARPRGGCRAERSQIALL